jgi:hypothetical protein
MNFINSSQIRSFKIVEKNNFSEDDLKWIKSLINVSLVTLQKKSIRVFIETEDAITGIIKSIDTKYCNTSKPKLSPLFCVLQKAA